MTITPSRWSAETQVNTSDGAGTQWNGQAVALPDGGYVVVWADKVNLRIEAQRYDVLGHKIGGEAAVSAASNFVAEPDIIRLSDGRLAVSFVTKSVPVDGNVNTSLQVAVLDTSLHGTRLDTIATVTAPSGDPQTLFGAALLTMPGGGYEIAYSLAGVIHGTQITDGGAVVPNTAFQYGTDSRGPELTMLTDGSVVVVTPTRDSTTDSVKDIRIDQTKDGNTISTLVSGAKDPGVNEYANDVAALKGGGFVVAWTDGGIDGDGFGVGATVYGSSVTQIVNDGANHAGIQVNTTTLSHQHDPSVVGLADGGFLISYSNDSGKTNGVATGNILAQRFDADGNKVGQEFVLSNTCTSAFFLSGGEESNLVLLGDGRVALVTNHAANPPDDFDVMTSIWDPRTGAIVGTSKADILTSRPEGGSVSGLAGDDMLFGVSGKDQLTGGKGDDALNGGGGADKLIGGKGADTLTGGVDDKQDLFIYVSPQDSGNGKKATWDHIVDFDFKTKNEAHSDKIDVSGLDADKGQGGDQAFRFVHDFGPASGNKPAGEIMLEDAGKGVKVLIDIDGDQQTDMIIQVMKVDTLHKADFIL